MRKIKFRGKRLDNGCWVYGSLIKMDGSGYQSFIFPFYKSASSMTCGQIVAYGMVGIDIETLGQFTGLYDKSGKEIFCHDILATNERDVIFMVVWDEETCGYKFRGNKSSFDNLGLLDIDLGSLKAMEIIGNIHDNWELIEKESN